MNLDKILNKLKKYKGKTVAVAMSGGVDSSVCAYLLKKAGANVVGITMVHMPNSKCCTLEDIDSARQVASQLDIPHYLVDVREKFENEVVSYFVNEHKKGRNPNPCVICNQLIKFGELLKEAEAKGAEFFATGHYAKLEVKKDEIKLKRPKDVRKDQSYVLSMLPRELFKKLIFPLGDLTKEEVREIAKEAGLKMYSRPGNQDLCFLDKGKGEFIEEWDKEKAKPGEIVDKYGKVLGRHRGIIHYSIGQRHGLGIDLHKRLFVININPEKNQIVVGEREEGYSNEFLVEAMNWVSIIEPKEPFKAKVLIRNKAVPQEVTVYPLENNKIRVVPKEPIWGVSPGQIAVFLKRNVVLGGGWII